MSIKIMNWIWNDERQTHGEERLILMALADQANDEGFTWPSLETIAKKANTDRRSVPRAAHKLIIKGLLTVTPREKDGRRTSNLYRVVYTPQIQAEEAAQGRLGVSPYVERGDTVTPPENAQGGDTVTPGGGHSDTRGGTERHQGGDTVTPESLINPHLSPNEPSGVTPNASQSRTWTTVLEQLQAQCDKTFFRRVVQMNLTAVRGQAYILTGPEPDLMRARLESTINRMLTGLEPGAWVEFAGAGE